MTKYALIAALVASLGMSAAVVWLQRSNARLAAENTALSARVAGCDARIQNILNDKRSDDAIDAIPDDGLRDVPPGWLLPTP